MCVADGAYFEVEHTVDVADFESWHIGAELPWPLAQLVAAPLMEVVPSCWGQAGAGRTAGAGGCGRSADEGGGRAAACSR